MVVVSRPATPPTTTTTKYYCYYQILTRSIEGIVTTHYLNALGPSNFSDIRMRPQSLDL